MARYAVIPEGTDMSNVIDLTLGKRYRIELKESFRDGLGYFLNNGHSFYMIDDDGFPIYCKQNNSNHLNGQNWEIQE
jgi:hypothetical protein